MNAIVSIFTTTAAALILAFCNQAFATDSVTNIFLDKNARFHPEISSIGMVVSQEAIASQVGADILEAGGNAIDAAGSHRLCTSSNLTQSGESWWWWLYVGSFGQRKQNHCHRLSRNGAI